MRLWAVVPNAFAALSKLPRVYAVKVWWGVAFYKWGKLTKGL